MILKCPYHWQKCHWEKLKKALNGSHSEWHRVYGHPLSCVGGKKMQIIRYSNLCHSICQSLNVMPPSLHHSSVPQGHGAITLDHMSQSAGDWYISPKYWERLSSHAIWQDFVLWLCKLKRVFHVSCFVRYDDRGKREKQKRDRVMHSLENFRMPLKYLFKNWIWNK